MDETVWVGRVMAGGKRFAPLYDSGCQRTRRKNNGRTRPYDSARLVYGMYGKTYTKKSPLKPQRTCELSVNKVGEGSRNKLSDKNYLHFLPGYIIFARIPPDSNGVVLVQTLYYDLGGSTEGSRFLTLFLSVKIVEITVVL